MAQDVVIDLRDLLARLRRVLEHERRLGYRDRAVLGGLDRFLSQWGQELLVAAPELTARWREVYPPGLRYRAFDGAARAAWVAESLRWLAMARRSVSSLASSPAPVAASAPSARLRSARAPSGAAALSLEMPLSRVSGVGTSTAARLRKLGVATVGELLRLYPRRYDDFTQLRPVAGLLVGEEQTSILTVWSAEERLLGGRRSAEAILGDSTGNIRAVWFNQPYVARALKPNAQIVLSGKVGLFRGQLVWESPAFEPWDGRGLLHTGRLVPVYPLTAGLHPRRMREVAKRVVDAAASLPPDPLPAGLRTRLQILSLAEALQEIHFPGDHAKLEAARRRLAFEELFLLQLGVLQKRQEWQAALGQPLVAPEAVQGFLASLPFTLTQAQRRSLEEVLADLARSVPMSRLLQGDVGSGKTVVALAALLAAVASDAQGVLLAPTEVLAEQHQRTLEELLGRVGEEISPGLWNIPYLPRPLRVRLLIGGQPGRVKALIRQEARQGQTDLLIGTHTLLQEATELPRLGLAVVDEQHRFGVMQRLRMRQKGFNPHVLVMSATPIPRSLALTLYGDLSLSTIDEMPPGRQRVRTRWVEPGRRELAEEYVRRRVAQGEQAFVLCPLVRESEVLEVAAATEEWRRWREELFPDLRERIGLLHGRLKTAEKEATMRRFRSGELAILVATPVVEVGIDVPNATVILVEAADRFGLSQLHQLRGRVGRGSRESACLLLAEDPSPEARERLRLVEELHDGFRLAEEDLRLRGPGEFFGTRQSGLPPLRLASLTDLPLLQEAREEAHRLLEEDPQLRQPEHRPLAEELARTWQEPVTEFS